MFALRTTASKFPLRAGARQFSSSVRSLKCYEAVDAAVSPNRLKLEESESTRLMRCFMCLDFVADF